MLTIIGSNWQHHYMYYSPTKGDWVANDAPLVPEPCAADDLKQANALIAQRNYLICNVELIEVSDVETN